ncbi:MAG: hypothetical protein LBJ17_06920 [Dysgonamonadaceae bacterium]|jgi:hypothetical protein|nr:hypothetical protein [Dysgonamonadaceae bacterium]
MILVILISSLSMFMSCCSTLFPDEKLSMQRKDYNGNEIKIDGYYYYFISDKQYNRAVVHFLYRNGMILSAGSFLGNDLNDIEKEMITYYDSFRKTDWGVFLVDSNIIKYEKVISADPAAGIQSFIIRELGYIDNDTTLHFTDSYSSKNNETKKIDKVWHFKQFDNKPDSTNVCIK